MQKEVIIDMTKIRSVTRFVNEANAVGCPVMLTTATKRINAKSLLGTMNLMNESKRTPVTVVIENIEAPGAGSFESSLMAIIPDHIDDAVASNR